MVISTESFSMASGRGRKAPLVMMITMSRIDFIRVWLNEVADDLFLCFLQLFRAQFELAPGEIEVIGTVNGHQVQVGMGNFQTHYGETATVAGNGRLDGFCNGPGKQQEAG